jgi:DNA-binding MarR family transcriptional regulator/N-acetylglutamate synthase-like GNAT family acetyltransferase
MSAVPAAEIAAVRRFTRFYTQAFGVLGQRLYDSALSLTEARVLYEIATRAHATAGGLGRDLGVDAGYLSRILRGFAAKGLVSRKPSPTDGRVQMLALTAKGRALFGRIDQASARQVGAILAGLAPEDRADMASAMARIERGLSGARGEPTLRAHRPGDMGWVVSAHGDLYARDYGWDIGFEAMVADIAAAFIRDFDSRRERCWIAELDGARVGSVFVVRASDEIAKLRMLIVDPRARGLGLGRRLVEEAIGFARGAGYSRMTLWTNDVLTAARAIYVKAGFRLAASEAHRSFGKDLVGETWELTL